MMLEQLGSPPVEAVLDVRDASAVEAFVGRVAGERGRVDVLVNNAAGTFYAHFTDTSVKGQSMLIDENFVSVANCVRAVLPVMPDGGSVLHVDGGAHASSGWVRRADGTYAP